MQIYKAIIRVLIILAEPKSKTAQTAQPKLLERIGGLLKLKNPHLRQPGYRQKIAIYYNNFYQKKQECYSKRNE